MDPFVGEIRMFGAYFAPEYWRLCDGSSLTINDYQELYALIGTTYGGDGITTFKLPDLRGRLPIGQGQGEGLTKRIVGQGGGSEAHYLTEAEMPVHTHEANAITAEGTQTNPGKGVWAATLNRTTSPATTVNQYIKRSEIKPTDIGELDPMAIGPAGGRFSHENMMPYLALNFIICVKGLFPIFS